MDTQVIKKGRGRPRKQELINDIEKEAGLENSSQMTTAVLEKDIPDRKNNDVEKINEFEDDYKLKVIGDYHPASDIFRIPSPDPRYKYRWLNIESKNMSRKTSNLLFQQGGWQVLNNKSHAEKIGFTGNRIDSEGHVRIGNDHILAFMPTDLWEKKEDQKQKKANLPMEKINNLLTKGDPSVGGKEMHESMKGIQTQKQLRMD